MDDRVYNALGRKTGDMKVQMQKGSFTVEAVIWIPLILCIMLGILQEGIQFYKESAEKEISEDIKEWDGVSAFYEFWKIKELGKEWNDE